MAKARPLTTREAIKAIEVLTRAIDQQRALWFGDEELIDKASDKIKELIDKIKDEDTKGKI